MLRFKRRGCENVRTSTKTLMPCSTDIHQRNAGSTGFDAGTPRSPALVRNMRCIFVSAAFASLVPLVPAAIAGTADDTVWYVYSDAGSPGNHGFWTNLVPANGKEMLRIDV